MRGLVLMCLVVVLLLVVSDARKDRKDKLSRRPCRRRCEAQRRAKIQCKRDHPATCRCVLGNSMLCKNVAFLLLKRFNTNYEYVVLTLVTMLMLFQNGTSGCVGRTAESTSARPNFVRSASARDAAWDP